MRYRWWFDGAYRRSCMMPSNSAQTLARLCRRFGFLSSQASDSESSDTSTPRTPWRPRTSQSESWIISSKKSYWWWLEWDSKSVPINSRRRNETAQHWNKIWKKLKGKQREEKIFTTEGLKTTKVSSDEGSALRTSMGLSWNRYRKQRQYFR